MQSAFIITDRTQKPYAVVGLMQGGTEIYPMTDAAKEWASWMADEFAARKITKDELVATIDNSMDIEGPIANTRTNKLRLEELIRKAKKSPAPESDKPSEKSDAIEMLSLADVILSDLSNDEWRNAVQFKAASFIADTNKSTFAYEVKRTRAIWDPSLSIPGTNRRGGWRCPVGTRYGGQITDRFGRNCGWGAARRLANAISDLGERLENVGDRRREGRVARRNERMVRRLREGGAIERGARAVARGLEGFEFNPENKPMARRRRRRGELGGARGRQGGMLERAAGRIADVLGEDTPPPRRRQREVLPGGGQGVRQPRAPRGGNLRPSEARRIERELERPGAPRTPRPMRPQPNKPQVAEKPSMRNTKPPAGGPNPGESLAAYKRRKYDEHQANVRKIREEGGNAGFLKYDEWDAFHGPVVEDNWRKGQGKGRAQRRASADNVAKPKATRRPKADDKPIDKQPPNKNPRKPFKAENARGFNDEIGAKRARNKLERENAEGDFRIVKHNEKYFVVRKEEIDKANANGANLEVVQEPPRPARRPPAPDKAPKPNAPEAPEVGDAPKPPSKPSSDLPNPDRKWRKWRDMFARGRVNDNRLGNLGKDGIPTAKRVEVGNAGINTKDDAIKHLASGGDIKDIPDDFVIEALNGNSGPGKRFTKGTVGDHNNVNGQLTTYTDGKTGKIFIAKYEKKRYAFNEDLNEVVGNNIAARLGFAVGEFRFAGPEFRDQHGQARPILMEHVDNYIDGVAQKPAREEERKLPLADKIGATLLDYLILNTDRHGGNFFVAEIDGVRRFIPIDPSLGFEAREFRGAHSGVQGMRDWLNSFAGGGRNKMLKQLREDHAAGRIKRDEVIKIVAQLRAELTNAENARPYLDFANEAAIAAGVGGKPRAGADGAPKVKKQVAHANERLQFVMQETPEKLADLILGI